MRQLVKQDADQEHRGPQQRVAHARRLNVAEDKEDDQDEETEVESDGGAENCAEMDAAHRRSVTRASSRPVRGLLTRAGKMPALVRSACALRHREFSRRELDQLRDVTVAIGRIDV